jgi:hypothetical protein
MKLCTPYLIQRNIRLARFRAEGRRRLVVRKQKQYCGYISPGREIIAPNKVNVARPDAVELVRFLRAVSITVLKMRKPTKLNFKNTKSFHVSGAVLLYAELNRIIALSDISKPVTIIEPRQRRPREVLKQIGIYQLTGDKSDLVPTREDVVFWKATKGSTQSGDALGPILEFVTERANRDHVDQVEISGIWPGVSEAVANAIEHAYDKPRSDGFAGLDDTKWWMFTQLRDQHFIATVCDLGCGYRSTIGLNIPESFRAKWQQLLHGKNHDAIAIQTAMEYGRSGTQLSNRGKGSRDALAVLAKHGNGTLSIISHTGWVEFQYADGVEVRNNSGKIGIDIGGTIVWWRLPLKDD